MGEASDFAEKAKETEAVAASSVDTLIQITLALLAKDYRPLAQQEAAGSTLSHPPSDD